jgi:hypothetical protein
MRSKNGLKWLLLADIQPPIADAKENARALERPGRLWSGG